MWGDIVGGLISGGLTLAGDLLDSGDDGSSERNAARGQDIALQKEFAQHGVSWRVADAERAGIHPLYALGATGATYSPTTYIGAEPRRSKVSKTLSHLGAMGQDVTRAIYATAPQEAREKALFKQSFIKGELENEILRSQLAQLKQTGPAFPSSSGMSNQLLGGQGDSGYSYGGAMVTEVPHRPMYTHPGRPGQDVGSISDYAYIRTPTGYAIAPSKDVKERIEDQIIPETMWAWRNLLKPSRAGLPAPDPKYYPLPKGADEWVWDKWKQEFRPYTYGFVERKLRRDFPRR